MEFENFLMIAGVAVGVVLLGVGVGVFTMMRAKRARGARDQWVRGAYSIWTGGEDSGAWTAQRAQQSLANWYGATNVGKFWEVIRGLRQGQTGNLAWDGVRALDLLRIGFAAQFIDAESCFDEATKIGRDLQQRHGSWEELAQAFEAGMRAWQQRQGITDPQETGRVQRNLPALRQQIWPAVDFKTTLPDD